MITDCFLRSSHGLNRGQSDIDQLVKRWNDRAMIDVASDRENYVNGNVKFLFEYSGLGDARRAPLRSIHRRNVPRYVPVVLAEAAIDKPSWEIGDLLDKHFRGNPCVVSGWNKKLVLIEDVEFMDKREKLVPARLTMGLQIEKSLIEGWGDPIGESRLYGFLKPCLGFTIGELQAPSFPFRRCNDGNDSPVGMVKSSAEIVNNISTNEGCPVYDGLVSFCKGGALSGICIRFDDVSERARFLEQYVQLVDVFRGPINLEYRAIGHLSKTPNSVYTDTGVRITDDIDDAVNTALSA